MMASLVRTYRRAYIGLPGRAWILFTVHLINSSGSMVIFFLSLYLTRKLGFSPARAGRALGLFGLGSLAGGYLGGWLTDRIGSTRVQKISLVLSGALLVLLGQLRTAASILPVLFLMPMAGGMLYPANAASMIRIIPPDLQVKGFALNRLAGNLGATIGPAVGGLLALRDYRLLFWADGLTALAAAAAFALLWRNPEGDLRALDKTRGGEAGRFASPWRDGPFLLLMGIVVVWGSLFFQIFSTFPLYMRSAYGLPETRIGQLMAVNTVLIVLFEMILMEKVRKTPLVRMINVSFLLLGLGLGLMPLGRGFLFGAATVAVWTFGEMLSLPLLTALIAGRAGPANQGRYQGIFSLAISLSLVVSPVAGTAVYGRFGGKALWFACGAAGFFLAAAFSLLRPLLAAPGGGPAGSAPGAPASDV